MEDLLNVYQINSHVIDQLCEVKKAGLIQTIFPPLMFQF